MRICLLGGTGQLGNELNKILQKETVFSFGRKDLDITKLDASFERLKQMKPDVIIHAAAYTNVDECEDRQNIAHQVNTIGTGNIAQISEQIGSKLIYISTDYVFDGEKGSPYNEDDLQNPINVYGRTKWAGELEVQKHVNEYTIVRTAWLYGHKGKNFIQMILNLANNKTLLNVVDDQRGCPTYTLDLALALERLIKEEHYGTFHLMNEGNCTWFELAEKICKLQRIEAKVNPVKTKDLHRKALRPKNSSLSNNSNIKLRHWQEAVEEFLRNYR